MVCRDFILTKTANRVLFIPLEICATYSTLSGPESAGAYPGLIAYSRGSDWPTVTDANVVLHRLNPKAILGGRMKIDKEAQGN
jgi:hypothetical protein